MSEVRTVEFNSLPPAVKDRFVAITKGAVGPAPALVQKTSTKSKVVGLSVLFILLGLFSLLVVAVGSGDPFNGLGIHGPIVVIIFYIPLAFLVLYLLLTIVMRIVVKSPFPFDPGRYLFATDFVDARTAKFRIVPTQLLTDFKGTHNHTNGHYSHTSLAFHFQNSVEQFMVSGKDKADAATSAFWDGQRAVAAAAQAQDWQTIANLDPFYECKRTGIWQQGVAPGAATGPVVKSVPLFFRWRAAIALVLAVFTCPVVALARNFGSDELMFSKAQQIDTEGAYEAYAKNGWRHVDAAKLAQPIAALRYAKEEGSVTEMRRVLTQYAGSSVENEARLALHELYSKTLRDFRLKAASSDARMLPFMERLIDYMEKNDTSTVLVVFSAPTTASLAEADEFFKNRYGKGGNVVEPISPYFNGDRSSSREDAIVTQMNTAFASIFPNDVLRLKKADSTSGSKDPSIAISYTVAPSGDAYHSTDGNEIFVGIDVAFAMAMAIPSEARAFDFKLKVAPPDEFHYRYNQGESQAEAAYEAMAARAFDEFTTKLQGVFFENVPAADDSKAAPGTSSGAASTDR